MTVPSFLFIVNDLITNDDPEQPGSIPPRTINGRWHPPEYIQGFYDQQPGNVYRWSNGQITLAAGYSWTGQAMGDPIRYANGTVCARDVNGNTVWPEYYRAATVFYCNRFDKFFTTPGDAGTRNIATCDPEYGWHPLTFFHNNSLSLVEHAGDQEHLAVRSATWIDELLPNAYRHDSRHGPSNGGLAGLLPILIALVAFSCRQENFDEVLRRDRAWRGYKWVRHGRPSGRISKRGMVVTVFVDPENPGGSTYGSLQVLEDGPTPLFR